MSAAMHHPSFGPPPIMSAEDCAAFYGVHFESLRICEICDCTAGVRDRAIPDWDEMPRLRCDDCAKGEEG